MILYCIIMISILILGYSMNVNQHKGTKKVFLGVFFCILCIFSSLRSKNVGMDTLQYWKNYRVIGETAWENYASLRYEFGYFALNKICYSICENPQILFIVSSMFIMFSVACFIYKNSNDVVLSTFLFVSLNFYFSYMNILRQAIAITIILFGFEYLKDKNYLKYLFVILIACQFHASAFLMIFPIIFINKKFNIKIFIEVVVLGLVLMIFSDKILLFGKTFSSYGGYIDSKYNVSNYFGALIECMRLFVIVCAGIFFVYIPKKDKNYDEVVKKTRGIYITRYSYKEVKNPSDIKYNNIHFISFMMTFALLFSMLVIKVNIFNRLMNYFDYYSIIWLPCTIDAITFGKNRLLARLIVIAISFLYCIIIMKFRPEWHGAVPYEFYWNCL